jgi:TetR/AcrR family transcriptional regulator, transcriptional repressor for nem operon
VRTTAANRRRGAEATQDELLDAVEHVLFDSGQARVSYRTVAGKAGVTPSLVQYYFPTIDDLFAAMIRRLISRQTDRWNKALQRRPDEPLRVLWEYSRGEAAGALGTEIIALGARRPALIDEISQGTERIRELQCEALTKKYGDFTFLGGTFPPDAMVLLVTSIPKMLSLEETVHVGLAHRQLIEAFEGYLDSVEPKSRARRTKAPTPTRRRSHS